MVNSLWKNRVCCLKLLKTSQLMERSKRHSIPKRPSNVLTRKLPRHAKQLKKNVQAGFVCVEDSRLNHPNGVMSSAVRLSNLTFTRLSSKRLNQ